MPNHTTEKDEKIEEKLKYIGLDLKKKPNFLKEYEPIEYRPARGYDENQYKIYKYVDVREIQILLTRANRMDMLAEKYEKAEPLYSYLDLEKEENMVKYSLFLKMLHTVKIEEIEKIEKEQEELNKKIPFEVKYHENYLWQIFYSEVSKQYFMLVPMVDSEYACFFYLLKKQIECEKKKKSYQIFVPICHLDYSGSYLKRSELADIENYLWLFTKDWPLVYEVYDKSGELSIHIVGQTEVYEKLKNYYKIELKEKEEAIKFLKLIKALFILQTETQSEYIFVPKIDKSGGLEFYFQERKLDYDDLFQFIEGEYEQKNDKLKQIKSEIEKLKVKLEEKQAISKKKDMEYLNKEKEIATYLECKKTFFGKIKFFFKYKKKKKKEESEEIIEKKQEKTKEKEEIDDKKIEEKPFYTIEDLVSLTNQYNENLEIEKNLKLDVKALEDKIKMMDTKIKNATDYINEIEKHNKSIFDFWKYTSKDEAAALNPGQEKETNHINLEKTFDYKNDLEDLGVKIDQKQRQVLSKEECDSIFLTTELLEVLNQYRNYRNNKRLPKVITEALEESLETLKKEAQEERALFTKENYDIFGGLSEDCTHINHILGKKHREIEKNKFKILDINKNITIKDYKEELKREIDQIESALEKSKVPISMSVYCWENDFIEEGFSLCHIDPQNLLKNIKKGKNKIIRINLEKMKHAVYLSNIIYFDNYNKTLPEGMELDDLVLLDNAKYEWVKKSTTMFRINRFIKYQNEVETIEVKEYDLIEKEEF